MANLRFLVSFIFKRNMPHLALFLTLQGGVVLAVAMAVTVYAYPQSLAELGLRHALKQHSNEDLDIQINLSYYPMSSAAYKLIAALVEDTSQRNVGWLTRSRGRAGSSATFFFNTPGADADDEKRPRANLLYLEGIEKHIRLLNGSPPKAIRSPAPVEDAGSPLVLEAMVDSETANALSLAIGQRVSLIPATGDHTRGVMVAISGIMEPNDPKEEYWLKYREKYSPLGQRWLTAHFFIPEASFFEALGPTFPKMSGDYWWFMYIDQGRIKPDTAELVGFSVGRLSRELSLRLRAPRVITELGPTARDFRTKLFFLRVPLIMIVAMVEAMILYYLWVVASALQKEQAQDMARLSSRGASRFQITSIWLAQGLIVAASGLILGLPLATLSLSLLGLLPIYHPISTGGTLPVDLSTTTLAIAAAASFVAFLAISIPAILSFSSTSIISLKSSSARPHPYSWLYKRGFDLLIAFIALLLLFTLASGRPLVSRTLSDSLLWDVYLLLTPALMLLGGSLLLLRIAPLLASFLHIILSHRLPIWASFPLRHMARDPASYIPLMALLILAASLGMFASSFGKTLERNYRERALYAVGSDVQLSGLWVSSQGESIDYRKTFQELPGIQKSSLVYRSYGSLSLSELITSVTILAVEPETFGQVAWFRNDFSGQPLNETLSPLRQPQKPIAGKPLPPNAKMLGVWIRPHLPRPELRAVARLSDGNGRYFDMPLGDLGYRDWQFLEGSLLSPGGEGATSFRPAAPLSLHSLNIVPRRGPTGIPSPTADDPGAVYLDGLQVKTDSAPTGMTIDGFETVSSWQAIQFPLNPRGESLETTESVVKEGARAAILSWGQGTGFYPKGVRWAGDDGPLPVLASRSLLQKNRLSLGDEPVLSFRDVNFKVKLAKAVDYFPTLNPERDDFLILPMDPALYRANIVSGLSETLPNEMWAKVNDTASLRQALQRLPSNRIQAPTVREQAKVLASAREDPLVAAGWAGMIALVFVAVFIVSVGGFAVYSFLLVRERLGEVVVLRILGLKSWQARAISWLDNGVLLILGLGAATWMGTQFGHLVMGHLNFTEGGEPVLPPFAFEADWPVYGGTSLLLATFFFGAALIVAWLFARLPLQEAIRQDEG